MMINFGNADLFFEQIAKNGLMFTQEILRREGVNQEFSLENRDTLSGLAQSFASRFPHSIAEVGAEKIASRLHFLPVVAAKDPQLKKFKKKHGCYQNASDGSQMGFSSDFLYAEGVAYHGLIPLTHAICVDKELKGQDSTWSKDGAFFLGFVARKGAISDQFSKCKDTYGFLEDHIWMRESFAEEMESMFMTHDELEAFSLSHKNEAIIPSAKISKGLHD